ncbi:ubiquitin carboxyl-terminal hydrolase 12-like protein isoform X2, partial [Tanacetum coccineum]
GILRRYARWLCVKDTEKPIDILERLNEMAGFAPDEEIELFQEYRSGFGVQCLHVDKTLTFLAKKVVRFRSREKPKEDTFSLTLLKIYNYDEVLSRLARYINLDDPSKIRLTSHNCWFIEKLKREPIKYRGVGHLSNMLTLYTRVKFSIQYMKRAIIKKAKFDISELNTIKSAKSSFVPVLFGHAVDDDLLHPHHSDRIYEAYMVIYCWELNVYTLTPAKTILKTAQDITNSNQLVLPEDS